MYNAYMVRSDFSMSRTQVNLNLCCGLELETEYGEFKITFSMMNGKEIIWKFDNSDSAIDEFDRIFRINS